MCDVGNICAKCYGAKMLVIGIIILVVAVGWPRYVWHAIGIIVILKGLIILAKPEGCGHSMTSQPKAKKK